MRSEVRIISENEFSERMRDVLTSCDLSHIGAVTGPGRSGAIASVYASHIMGFPFVPYGARCADDRKILIIDTARKSGRTLRKAAKRYEYAAPTVIALFEEPPRVRFWYEMPAVHHNRNRDLAA